ncbi:hypothetical protein Pla108_26710 [Botrimarina colliarenosi]|uniref:Ice-binding protein C-terminal domain-containing protein n=2 Tax=Botrimarina colliarenosi TaxID=2528001 RepID=A0A5C6ABW8_9BACT|nr:hypothetical protein Pla108_26710 [Botrimarina colliarenosi]
MRNFILAALLVISASAASAGTISASAVDTPGLSGYQTVTFSYEEGTGESFRGFDATFEGVINQINPFTLGTVFTDNNAVIPAAGGLVAQDSQFLFASSQILSIGAQEGPGILKAAVSNLAPLNLPNPVAFAQVVTNAPLTTTVRVALDNGTGLDEIYTGTVDFFVNGGTDPMIPEPSTAILAGLALVGFAARRNG